MVFVSAFPNRPLAFLFASMLSFGIGACESEPSPVMDAAGEGENPNGGTGSGSTSGGESSADEAGSDGGDPGGDSGGTGESGEDSSTDPSSDAGSGEDSGGDEPAHVIRLEVNLTPDQDGMLSFLTAAGTVVTKPITNIVGKPYYVSIFDGGFEQGVDLDRTREWSTMPDDLHVIYDSPPMFESGPYDVSFIVYTETEITDEIKQEPFPPAPVAGELSAFTISQDQVKPGDPGFENGVVRVNVEGNDATLVLENHHDLGNLLESFTDTVLVVP